MRNQLLVGALVLATTAFAQEPAPRPAVDPAKRAAIEDLLTVMKIDENTKQVLPQIQQMMVQVTEKAMPPELRDRAQVSADLAAFQNRLFDLFKDKLALDNMKPYYIKAYDETFSAEEISGIAAFYKSPAGQSFVTKQPTLTGKVMSSMQGMMAELMPQVEKMTADWTEEMKKKYGGSDAK